VSAQGPARAVISDLGGVLTTPLVDAFTAFRNLSGVSFEQLGTALQRASERHGSHPLFDLECGRLTESEFFARVQAELPDGARLEGFRSIYWDALEPNSELLAYLRGLHARGLRLALLTNNVREWEPIWRAKLPEIDELFDVVVDSAFVGMRKPDPAIYELTLDRLGDGLAAGDCVFVDDIEHNVEAARALGMRAVHFRATPQAIRDIEAAVGGGE
jgi:putative hydrolase of the HAD superfamily